MTAAKKSRSAGAFSDAERAAMKERAEEVKSGRGARKKADDLDALLAKIAEMQEPDRTLAERIHAIVTSAAPELTPKTWYGMPAYAKDGKVICFYKPKSKFKVRYSTFEFQPDARLDDGEMWPTSFAVTELTPKTEARIVALVKKAAS
jgi:uncharacterized protein YdhG (YjbR/CyaY superfamily)